MVEPSTRSARAPDLHTDGLPLVWPSTADADSFFDQGATYAEDPPGRACSRSWRRAPTSSDIGGVRAITGRTSTWPRRSRGSRGFVGRVGGVPRT